VVYADANLLSNKLSSAIHAGKATEHILDFVKRIGNGELICLTGRMPWLRAELYKICTAAGFVPVDRYNSSVSLVVYADANLLSNKLSSAIRSGKATEHILDFVKRINAIV
jgi:hypothetical protein